MWKDVPVLFFLEKQEENASQTGLQFSLSSPLPQGLTLTLTQTQPKT